MPANSYYTNTKVDGEFMEAADLEAIEQGFYDLELEALFAANNLSDIVNASTARVNLGISALNTPYDNAGSGLIATEVESALDELDVDVAAVETSIGDHIADAIGAHAGSAIANTPTGNLAATTVQAALNELQGDIDGLTAGGGEPTNYEVMDSNGDVGTSAGQLAIGNHVHTGVYEPVITGGATTIVSANLTANRALISSGTGKVAVSSTITSTELGYLNGLTELISTSLAGKAATTVTQGQHTISMPATGMKGVGATPAATQVLELANDNDVDVLAFDTAQDEHAQFGIWMPKSWNEGTVVVQFIWTAISGTGTVKWTIAATAFGDSDLLTTAITPTLGPAADTLLTANDLHKTAEYTLTVGGTPAAEEYVIFEVMRDVSADTLGVDAMLIGVKIHYTTNSDTDN